MRILAAFVNRIGPGGCFGELAQLIGKVRSAYVVTLEECEMLELRKEDLDDFVSRYPRFATSLKKYAEGRLARR